MKNVILGDKIQHFLNENISTWYFWGKRMMFLHMINQGHILRWI